MNEEQQQAEIQRLRAKLEGLDKNTRTADLERSARKLGRALARSGDPEWRVFMAEVFRRLGFSRSNAARMCTEIAVVEP